jgi:hypothetical protein
MQMCCFFPEIQSNWKYNTLNPFYTYSSMCVLLSVHSILTGNVDPFHICSRLFLCLKWSLLLIVSGHPNINNI